MRTIPSALQDRLDQGVTTLCRCWRLERRDGTLLGFTDHDGDVVLDGLVCRADTGLSGSEVTGRLGLAVTGSEVTGALADETLTEDDLAAGRYDMARIELYLVDWSEPALNVLLASGTLGEVRREGAAFAAEIRGLADALNQESGRRYGSRCDADLGDARCGVNLTGATYKADGHVQEAEGVLLTVAGLDDFETGWFTAGRLLWTAGENESLAIEIKRHRREDNAVTLELWQPMPHGPAPGDTFTITAGCDKHVTTCRSKFANVGNFRGFPHIPGNDFVTRYAISGEPGHTGASLQR